MGRTKHPEGLIGLKLTIVKIRSTINGLFRSAIPKLTSLVQSKNKDQFQPG